MKNRTRVAASSCSCCCGLCRSTNGRYIKCSYRIDILAEIDWAPDIEIEFPLNIFMPPVQWQEALPADSLDYLPVAEACVVEPLPFKDGTVIPLVTEAAVVLPVAAAVAAEEGVPTQPPPGLKSAQP